MKTCYVDYATRSIADLTDYYGKGLIITRINVPKPSRGKGLGTKLLKEILADADVERVTLWLEILPSGDLGYEELQAWYERHGFKQFMTGLWKRRPQVLNPTR